MKMTKMTRILCLMLVAIMTLSFVACAGGDTTGTTPSGTTDGSKETTTEGNEEVLSGMTTTPKEEYDYPEEMNLSSFKGDNAITFLNCSRETWQMISYFTYDKAEDVGQTNFEQSIYKRQNRVQDQLGCELKEDNIDIVKLNETLNNNVVNKLNTYDAAYQRADQTVNMIIKGFYKPLNEIDTIQLEKNWWIQSFLEDTSLFDQSFFALSNLQLTSFESVWCIFFNAEMLDNEVNLDRPYDLVRSGDWTWDELLKYCEAARNLKGATNYNYSKNAKTVYGMSSFVDGVNKFIYGVGALFADKDANGNIVWHGQDETFEDACLEVAYFMQNDGRYVAGAAGKDDDNIDYYIDIFKNERSLFLGAEIKTAQELRQLNWEYGILPFPKANPVDGVKQENYMSTCFTYLPVLTIPAYPNRDEATNITSYDEIGVVVDALSCESDNLVLDNYYNSRVSLQGLKTEDNIDMLNIIKDSRGFDIFVCYGFSEYMISTVCTEIHKGGTTISSTIANGYENGAKDKIAELEDYVLGMLG